MVFEILSPSNRLGEMSRKLGFYDRYGVEEYYVYDPDRVDFTAWLRSDGGLELVDFEGIWTSPLLGIRFELTPQDLTIYRSVATGSGGSGGEVGGEATRAGY